MLDSNLIATLTVPTSLIGKALPEAVRWLEIRADLTGDLDPIWLRSRFQGRLLYSLRSRDEGGHFEGSPGQRLRRLRWAADRGYDLIEMEGQRDLRPDLLDRIPPDRRLISWHGPSTDEKGLRARFDQVSAVDARVYKLVPTAVEATDGLVPLSLLNTLGRADTIAYAAGPAGSWTRLLAPRLGMPTVFGPIDEDDTGAFTIFQLIEDYGLPTLEAVEEVFGIVGRSVQRSLSPRLHNAAYRILGRPAVYLPFQANSFVGFYHEMAEKNTLGSLGISFGGSTVASPHKEAVVATTRVISPMARRAGAANVLLRSNGTWKADTTDPAGVLQPLRRHGVPLEFARVAVVGCGGAGRAAAAALKQAGARVTLVNRGLERGEYAARLLGLPFVPLTDFGVLGFSVVINATPVGGQGDEQPFQLEGLRDDAVVIDLVYGSAPTRLISNARDLGLDAIDGREVLFFQTQQQFRLMTGLRIPPEVTEELGPEPDSSSSVFPGEYAQTMY